MVAGHRRPGRIFPTSLWNLGLAAWLATTPGVVRADAPEPEWTGGGPDIGWVTELHRFTAGSSIYAGTFGGGVFRSDDGGDTWTDVSGNLRGVWINDLESAFGDDNQELYAGTDDSGLNRADSFFTTSWTPANVGLDLGPGPIPITAVKVHPHDLDMVSISSIWGMHTSNDRGRTWEDSLSWMEYAPFKDVAVSALAPNTVYGLEATDFLRWSSDHGDHIWTAEVDGFLEELELWPTSLDTMFVVAPDVGVYRAFDRFTFTPSSPWEEGEIHGRVHDLELVDGTHEMYLGGERELYHSQDLGATWTEVPHGLGRFAELNVVMVDDAADRTLIMGSATNGILKTGPDASDWTRHNQGLRAAVVVGVEAWGDEVLITTLHGRVYYSADAGDTWDDRTANLRISHVNGIVRVPSLGRWIIGSGRRDLWLSDNQGQSWRKPDAYDGPNQVNQVHSVPWEGDQRVYALTFQGLYETVDGGETWTLNGQLDAALSCTVFGAAPGDRTMWVGQRINASSEARLYRREEQGPFAPVEILGGLGTSYQALAFPDLTAGKVLLGTEFGMFALVENPDGTYTPFNVSSGLPGVLGIPSIWDVQVDPNSGIYYVALLEGGVYRSADEGESWQVFNQGMRWPRVQTLALAKDRPKSRLYAATFGRGVYGRTLDTSVAILLYRPRAERTDRGVRVSLTRTRPGALELWRSVDQEPFRRLASWEEVEAVSYHDDLAGVDWARGVRLRYEARIQRDGVLEAVSQTTLDLAPSIPTDLVTRLRTNVPNPFNPSTILRLELATRDRVRVDVYDLRGRHVARLHDADLAPGQHQFRWTALDDSGMPMPSGVYLSRVKVGARVMTGRMTLVR